jgi:hypothetical protein
MVCIPYDAPDILLVDTNTRECTTFGSLSDGPSKWCGGVRADNGEIICIPSHAQDVLAIDTRARTVARFGSVPAGPFKYSGGVYHEGIVYGIPSHASTVLAIDPQARAITTFGVVTGSEEMDDFEAAGLFSDAVLAEDGLIYCIPLLARYVLVIDPLRRTLAQIGMFGPGLKWDGAVPA